MSPELFADYVGRTVGGCRIRCRIGAGGMGVVFEAHHLALDKRVALKLLMPNLAADSSFVKRFVSEARLAAQVEHPNIVQVLNVGQQGAVYFIVMQFIEGRSLAEFLGRGPLAPRDAVKIVIQAARGLAAAHRRGIIHRDVKPENILVDKAGVARIVDMGLSKSLAAADPEVAGLTAPGIAMGTPNYISPEQATEARAADARTDIYSLGATLYHALTGAPPFDGPSAIAIINKHINQPLPPPSSRRAQVPRELDALIARMMAKDPAERIGTMDEVVAELKKHLAASGAASAAVLTPAAGPATEEMAPVGPGDREAVEATMPLPGARQEPAAPRRPAWKLVLLGAAGMLGALVVLGILASAADPARKAFKLAQYNDQHFPGDYDGAIRLYRELSETYPGSKWSAQAQTAIAAVEGRRAADAGKALEELEPRAGPLEKSGKWAEAEKLWTGFPAGFRETPAGRQAAGRAERARVARRSAELFAALMEGGPDKAAVYLDPRKDPKAIRFVLALAVVGIKLSKAAVEDFRVEQVALEGPDRAALRMSFKLSHGALRPPEQQEYHQSWERVNGEWYMVDNKRLDEPGSAPGPRRGRALERPDRPERPGKPEASGRRMAPWA